MNTSFSNKSLLEYHKRMFTLLPFRNTGGAGRGDQRGNVIGGVILHDKKQYWGKCNVHYHRGMIAGVCD